MTSSTARRLITPNGALRPETASRPMRGCGLADGETMNFSFTPLDRPMPTPRTERFTSAPSRRNISAAPTPRLAYQRKVVFPNVTDALNSRPNFLPATDSGPRSGCCRRTMSTAPGRPPVRLMCWRHVGRNPLGCRGRFTTAHVGRRTHIPDARVADGP